jgi:phosphoenolpyruvate carboxykinase (GTP)
MTADIASTDASQINQTAPTTHQGILDWVNEVAELTQPERVYWCTGSDEEWVELTDALVETGTFVRLNEEKKPNSFWAASDPTDVARVEDRTSSARSTSATQGPPTTGWTRAR